MKKIIGINGSATENSSNFTLLKRIAEISKDDFEFEIVNNLGDSPHFRTDQADENTPEMVQRLRDKIAEADAVIICTPEYVFSIPSRLKNIIEWCVSTTIFSNKPVGLVTASASGERGHEELKLIMKTVQSIFNDNTTLHIPGVKSKVNRNGEVTDLITDNKLKKLARSLNLLIETIQS